MASPRGLPDAATSRMARPPTPMGMAPEFSPGFIQVFIGLFVAFVIGVTVGIYVLGRVAGAVLPPVRHVAPLAFGALAAWLSPVRDGRLIALWVGAGVVGAVDALLRDVSRRPPPPGSTPPVGPSAGPPR